MNKKYRISMIVLSVLLLAGGKGKEKLEVTASENSKEQSSSQTNVIAVERKHPIPSSGLYTDMVVDKLEYVPLSNNDKVVYITFDDGPCESTPELLSVLKRLNIKATFFVTAQFGSDEKVVEWMKQIHEAGHELGVHSYSHEYKEIYQSQEEFLADYKKMDDLIIQATGERSHAYRFPGGSSTGYNKSIRNKVIEDLNSRGIVYYDWNAYDGDCEGVPQSRMVSKSVRECGYKKKSILLMHNTPVKKEVISSLPDIVKQLKKQGYRFDVLDGTVEPIQFTK